MSAPFTRGPICFGDRLRALAGARGLRRTRDLAKAIGCSVATARRYLNSITPPPRYALLEPIASALDVPYEQLLDGVRDQYSAHLLGDELAGHPVDPWIASGDHSRPTVVLAFCRQGKRRR